MLSVSAMTIDYANVVIVCGLLFLFVLLMFQGKALRKTVEVKYIEGHPAFKKKIVGELVVENNNLMFKRLYLNEVYFQIPIHHISKVTISSIYTIRRVTLFIEYKDKEDSRVVEFSTLRNKVLVKIKEEIDERMERYEKLTKKRMRIKEEEMDD